MSEEKQYKDWNLDMIYENKNDEDFINNLFKNLNDKFIFFLEKYSGWKSSKDYLAERYGYHFKSFQNHVMPKIYEDKFYFFSFVINFLEIVLPRLTSEYEKSLDYFPEGPIITDFQEMRNLKICFKKFAENFFLYCFEKNNEKKNWYDDRFFLIKRDLMPIIKLADNLNINNWLLFNISNFYKTNSMENKEAVLYKLSKDLIDSDIGNNYKRDLFNKNDLNNIWRKKIHAIRHGQNSEKKNENNIWWTRYNKEFNEKQKNKFLEDLLFFLVVFWIDKEKNEIK